MASVPNMRPAAANAGGEAPAPADGDKGDAFARILSLAPVAAPAAAPVIAVGDAAPAADTESKPAAGEDEQSDSADAVALTVPLPPTDLIPLVAAQAATPVVANPVAVAASPRARSTLARNVIVTPGSPVPAPGGKSVLAVANAMSGQDTAAAAKAAVAGVTVARTASSTTRTATGNPSRVAGLPLSSREATASEAAPSTDKHVTPAIGGKAAAGPIASTPHAAEASIAKTVPPATPDPAPRQKLHIRTGGAAAHAFSSLTAARTNAAEPQVAPTAAVLPRPDAATILPATPAVIATQTGKLPSGELPDPDVPAVEAQAVETSDVRNSGKPAVASAPIASRLVGSTMPLPAAASARAPTAAPAATADSTAQPLSRQEATPVPTAPRLDIAQAAFVPQSAAAPATAQADPAKSADPLGRTIERELHLVRDTAWLDQLARDIARSADGDAPMRFRLHPQTLGHLRVELAQTDQGTTVRFTAETEAARHILADAQPRLAAEARAQGVRIAESHVDLAGSGQDSRPDSRRQETGRAEPQIRTARPGRDDNEASGEAPRARTDRFA